MVLEHMCMIAIAQLAAGLDSWGSSSRDAVGHSVPGVPLAAFLRNTCTEKRVQVNLI